MRQTTLFGGILISENKAKGKPRDTESLTSTDPLKDDEDQGAVPVGVSESRTVEVKSVEPENKKISEKKRSKLSLTKESLPNKKDCDRDKGSDEQIKSDMSSETMTSTKSIGEAESKNGHKTVSYADFLGSITSECADVGDSERGTLMDTPPTLKPKQSDSKSRSITSYFTKANDSSFTKVLKRKEQSTVIVTAEIHTTSVLPLKEPPVNIVQSTNGKKCVQKEKINNCNDDSIEILSSETIFEEGTDSAKPESKKRKYEFDNHGSDATPVTGFKKVKSGVEQNVNEIRKNSTVQPEMLISLTPSSTRTTQPKLCFGKTSLSLTKGNKSDLEKVSDSRNDISTEETEITEGRVKNKRQKSKGNVEMQDSQNGKSSLNAVKSSCNQKELRKHPEVEEQEASMPSTVSNKAESIDEAQAEKHMEEQSGVENTAAVESGSSLRRSSRLVRPVQTKPKEEDDDEMEVVVCSDDEDDDVKRQAKSKRGRKKAQRSALMNIKDSKCTKDSHSQKTSKPSGKLAPIFTKMKGDAEEEVKVVAVQEDPEKARLRREFLMSGVPHELKKLIASSAAQAVVLDYPPFPCPSHVQQACSYGSSQQSVEMLLDPRLFEAETSENEGLTSPPFPWSSFCELTEEKSEISKPSQFEDFTSHPSLMDSQVDAVLTALQSLDPNFPFREVYNSIKAKQLCGGPQGEKASQGKDSSDLDEVVIVDDFSPPPGKNPASVVNVDVTSCLWPDVYQPCSASEVIGNGKVIKHLKCWLEEWKALMLKDARKASKGNKMSGKQKEKDGSWSDDSDFTHSEDDDEEEDTSLCNTMLITGPHGVGKTSTVYALAKELGYKVFEVSSSSLRSGKQLLFHLEEATQSHRVAQSPCLSTLSTPPPGSKTKPETKPKPAVSKATSAFANLFNVHKHAVKAVEKNKTGDKGSEKEARSCSTKRKKDREVKAKDKKKKQREKSQAGVCEKDSNKKKTSVDTNDEGTALGSLNLASSSLILFDEVDIVFEEDRGFLATVQHFMTSTKIPIILTCSESSFPSQLTARHEHISFRPSPMSSAANFMQMVCLAHGVRTCQKALCSVLHLLNCDIRKCLLALQFWVESGGGRIQASKGMNTGQELLHILDREKRGGSGAKAPVQSDDSNDAQFLCLQPGKKRPRRMVFEDEDSDSSNSGTFSSKGLTDKQFEDLPSSKSSRKSQSLQLAGTHGSGRLKTAKRKTENDVNLKVAKRTEEVEATLPVLHLACEESILGLQNCSISVSALAGYIQRNVMSAKDFKEALSICSALSQVLPLPALYSCTLHALPLAKCPIPVVSLTVHHKATQCSGKKKRRRIYMEDFFDSEGSDSELDKSKREAESCVSSGLGEKQNDEEDSTPVEKNSSISDCVEPESSNISEENDSLNMWRKHSRLAGPLLSEFAKYYETNSFLDMLDNIHQSGMRTENCLRPGLSDEMASFLVDTVGPDTMPEVGEALNLLASRRFYSGVASCLSKHENEEMDGLSLPEEFHLPISEKDPDLWRLGNRRHFERKSDPLVKSVCASLGSLAKSTEPAIHMDYLPVLRDICRQEEGRQASKTKRRFHHYLDHIGLGLKESVVCKLASTYTVVAE